ncbi:cytidylyltransferase domain-containing protein [Thiorhodovibrio frisius]|uniref:Spore coat polysaccharide biosynthesis protein F, CMP-KDO synthetase n=1 Tax=Thiorhodovibrio frisius TaxID=631362 RepID=H8Z4C8_9GAMM|nr:glycosyltransferase family protein [Thiorhodovibrio frisius]EIC20185.1 spore coat polysaccharide biosynthesis protein F, CMP-KDO synthetase [Thiorhodovibrio frisius]WPL20922.1 3-deoxy-manno-octulosonate cytidylyltransferase [Thiorhodovibrio frisius]
MPNESEQAVSRPPERTVAIIQARMTSTRLPGKVMRELCGVPVIGWVIRRVKACPLVDAVVVATTTNAADDELVRAAGHYGASVYRGSEQHVLSRYCEAAAEHQADVIIRITADCPLYDPELLTRMLERWRWLRAAGEPLDYLSNMWGGVTWPRGLDTTIFTRKVLDIVCKKSTQAYQFEHVTPYIYQHPQDFRLRPFRSDQDLSQHRWTLDTEDDWLLIEAIYQALGDDTRIFPTSDVLDLLDAHPELCRLNAHVRQKTLGD